MQVTKNKTGTHISVGANIHFTRNGNDVFIRQTLTNDVKSKEIFRADLTVEQFAGVADVLLSFKTASAPDEKMKKTIKVPKDVKVTKVTTKNNPKTKKTPKK